MLRGSWGIDMKVQKVIINLEDMDVRGDRVYFEKYRPSMYTPLGEPFRNDIEREEWRVQEVIQPGGMQRKKYLVKVDQLGLWSELFHIHRAFLDEYIYKETAEFLQEGRVQGIAHAVQSIKKLSWWRRLTCKF